ncbi:MAG: (E)-4-hydroxy-3-methylbut-2-enyl-diphosphate synthase [Planctomycetes bacterium]|nr:(E)-4-hydroxy-3-methylbut-2-enyl-diphosphate synthase [Planctomycetota bacterium]
MADSGTRLAPRRRPTRVVHVGDVAVGGEHPIRVQSMTTTFTYDVPGTLEQIERLVAAGCEIVRVTVPSLKDAQALPEIRAGMAARGLHVPLVADIHFSPKLAMLAVEHVEKVRVNPGNFTDTKRFAQREYTDAEYAQELERIEAKFTPLVLRAKERGISMRIGTNHGSLSDRIVNRYGDSPQGMVESALEFVRICRKHDYHALIISMKASNTRVMTEAYRLLAAQMDAEGMDYPFHLGVTEAGDGDPARIKSAIGIGGLLQDGIGDTIRVSLTEDPAAEVPVGFAIARRGGPGLAAPALEGSDPTHPTDYARRATRRIEQGCAAAAMGDQQDVRVEAHLGRANHVTAAQLAALGGEAAGERRLEVARIEVSDAADIAALAALREAASEANLALDAWTAPAVWRNAERLSRLLAIADRLTPREATLEDVPGLAQTIATHEDTALLLEGHDPAALAEQGAAAVEHLEHVALSLLPTEAPLTHPAWVRALVAELAARGLDLPLVVVASDPDDDEAEQSLVDAATSAGALLVDGIGDALRIESPTPARSIDVGYGILQGARRRTTETEYISCPGCGRTLFELEPVTQKIKERTAHLKGLKVAVMGCIVNGPGEMADADFGYVGWKPGKVNLYVGKECVVREVPEDEAPDRLVQLIKDHGRWIEPGRATPLPVL